MSAHRTMRTPPGVCHDHEMPTETTGVHERVIEAVAECQDALQRLQPLIAEPDRVGPRTGTIGRSAPESSPPWNEQAADAYWAIWFGAGQVVTLLRYALDLRPITPPRGAEGLAQIPNLIPAAPEHAIKLACRDLSRWASRAMTVPAIDEDEAWAPLPSVLGSPPPCPYCHTFALRMLKRKGEVRCFFPGCTDADGTPTRARMEPGRMTGEARLVFGDGTTMGVGDG